MTGSAQIMPNKKRRGYDSSRLIIVGNLIGSRPPLILCTVEERGDSFILRLPGGKAHRGEDPKKCAHRERREETGLHQSDLDTELREVGVRKGKGRGYVVHLYLSGIEGTIPTDQLAPTDEAIRGLFWANLTMLVAKGVVNVVLEDGRDFGRLKLQESHHGHLRALKENQPHFLEDLVSCIMGQDAAKSAS